MKTENKSIAPLRCDLHLHTNYSDGTLTPYELVDLAERESLYAIALTDHNTVAGLPEFLSAGEKSSVKTLGGIEFSTEYFGKEVHIIALGIKPCDYEKITVLVEKLRERKRESAYNLIDRLISAGYKIDRGRIESGIKGQINRAHIATELVRCGYVSSREEAFATLLSKSAGFYIEPKQLPVFDTIKFIDEIGAVSILAHPLLNLTREETRNLIKEGIKFGLDATEVFYVEYTDDDTDFMKRTADEFRLLYSGGSDFHGENKPRISIGRGLGNLAVDGEVYDKIAERLRLKERY